ncbi:hypothetical protein C8A05DRAFT_15363 [Staphylotrichum tortipilum]|uniref:Uncharacterized protein n=1 Tax=Staphylotrichum tortipilum TaxID=2831512 RepID=A0AAN6RT97_9PEZI|nr:hypothetical protein C8A05DRAFT_15363 [Staphylotrichum longicolle]
MANKFDKHIDRLEKLFSRRKRSVDSNEPPATTCTGNNNTMANSTTTGIVNGMGMGMGNTNRPGTPIPFLSVLDANPQTFPEPSFIRPTSSRMMAREEVHPAPGATRRAKSLPESPTTPRLQTSASLTDDGASTGSASPETRPPLPPRRSSFGHDLTQRSSSLFPSAGKSDVPAELIEFSFAAAREAENDISPTRRSRPGSKTLARSTSVSVSPKARVDRKRLSATGQLKLAPPQQPVNDERPESPEHTNKDCSSTQPQRESPCLATASRERPVRRLSPPVTLQPKLGADLMGRHIRSRVSQRPTSLAIPGSDIKNASEALRKSISLSTLPSAKTASEDPTLKEPSLTDFLALSDDDIADDNVAPRLVPSTTPVASMLPTFGPPRGLSPTSTPLRTQGVHPLLTLSPPLATRPTAAAAFEAARIASKYQLDLVYVVNLWPGHISHPSRSSPLSQMCGTPVATSPVRTTTTTSPSPPHSPASNASGYDSGFDSRAAAAASSRRNRSPRGSGMTGRLLAAYGLPSIMYPFRISAPVHQKVLRTEGWLEYRNDTGAHDEFARGYSCSFYTGHSPARRDASSSSSACSPTSSTSSTPTTTAAGGSAKRRKLRPSPPANRGIVFAAFRLPRPDGSSDACDPAELEALHHDAEALVDMLIDIHMTQRRGRAGLPSTAAAAPAPVTSPAASVRAPAAVSSPSPMPYHNRCAAASAGRRLAVNAPLVAI